MGCYSAEGSRDDVKNLIGDPACAEKYMGSRDLSDLLGRNFDINIAKVRDLMKNIQDPKILTSNGLDVEIIFLGLFLLNNVVYFT